MIFTTNKQLNDWGKVLHDEDMAAAILDRILERGRFIHLDGPSGRTRHLNPEETLPENTKRLRISGIGGSEFPEPTSDDPSREIAVRRQRQTLIARLTLTSRAVLSPVSQNAPL